MAPRGAVARGGGKRAAPGPAASEKSSFARRVFAAVRGVPAGRVTTYAAVAAALGSPRLAQAVGNALHTCTDTSVPAHRVINAGFVVAPASGKRARLAAEGVHFDARCRLADARAALAAL